MKNKRWPIKNLLVSRVDAIGDVVLTLPLIGLLKRFHPEMKITFLGLQYTQSIIEACEHCDAFIDWSGLAFQSLPNQANALRAGGFDAVLHVFPQRDVAQACRAAGIPLRMGTVHRWYHLFSCNRLVRLGRTNTPWH